MGLYINAKTATKTELQLKVMFWINSPVEDRGSKAALERPLSRIVGHRPFRRHPYRGSWLTGRFGATPVEDGGSEAALETPRSRIAPDRPRQAQAGPYRARNIEFSTPHVLNAKHKQKNRAMRRKCKKPSPLEKGQYVQT